MSYDLRIMVKVEGCNTYPVIATPEYDNPTYNLATMFRACMDWDYKQSHKYKCDFAIKRVENGIRELKNNREKYVKYNPSNEWGNIDSAITTLESLRDCIREQEEDIPLNCLYMSW